MGFERDWKPGNPVFDDLAYEERMVSRANGKKHIHIAERCKYGHTKGDCGHDIPFAAFQVRKISCDPEFCYETDFPEPTFEELQALVENPKFTEVLRKSEKEIATNPAEYGTTAEGWERIRQWPGEFYDRGELYDREEGTT